MSGYTAIVPVKALSLGKSRLHPDARVRSLLARAFALDTIDALVAATVVERVVVVTNDPTITDDAHARGVDVVVERRGAGADLLDDAVVAGRDWAEEHFPYDPVAVVPADLPAATGPALDGVLDVFGHDLGFVPDADGVGTTLLLAARPELLDAAYGGHSARAHRSRGAMELAAPVGLRRDVDTMDDLGSALESGVGAHTSAALEGLRSELGAEWFRAG